MDVSDLIDRVVLPPEQAADLSIASDRSFVQTSSGPAARELKRQFDYLLGVSPSRRSPYAITAFVSQHGRQMFRVGNRHLTAPAAAAREASPPREKRRPRMSVHHIFTPNVFHRPSLPEIISLSRPQTATSPTSPHRKLRKTRSFGPGDLQQDSASAFSPIGRAHSYSVTSADVSRFTPLANLVASLPVAVPFPYPQYSPPNGPALGNVPLPPSTPLAQQGTLVHPSDAFAQVMQWRFPKSSNTNPSSRDRAFVQHPFGAGVAFDSPVRKTPRVKRNDSLDSDLTQVPVEGSDPDPVSSYHSRLVMPTSNNMLREMQSFESTMTARQFDIIESETARVVSNGGGGPSLPETPETANDTPLLHTAPSVMNDDDDDQVIPVNEALRTFISHDEHRAVAGPSSRYTSTPDVFDVLQTYTGLPLLDRLLTGKRSTDETTVIRMSLTAKEESAAPRDDPRFVIWGWENDVVSSAQSFESTMTARQFGIESEMARGTPTADSSPSSWGRINLDTYDDNPPPSAVWLRPGTTVLNGGLTLPEMPEADAATIVASEWDSKSDLEGSRSRSSLGSRRSREDSIKARPGEFSVVEDPSNSHQEHVSDDSSLVPTSDGKKVIIAATIERWAAQLTSESDYDELMVFFLTYRTYNSATDLCRVLFDRLNWALKGGEDGQWTTTFENSKVCDDRVRRIVRIRTFIAIRYWLIQFWHIDFVPNRELRLLMADCLNQLNGDPSLKKDINGLSIVKRLIRVAKERRRAMLTKTAQTESYTLGEDSDADLDLDFLPEEQGARASELLGSTGAISSGLMMGSSNVAAQGPGSSAHPFHANSQLPEGAISRVVRTTFGRLKRALSSRALSASGIAPPFESVGLAPANEVSAFEVDTSGDRSSASIRRGIESHAPASLPLPNVLLPTLPQSEPVETEQDPVSPERSLAETQKDNGPPMDASDPVSSDVNITPTGEPTAEAMGSDVSSDVENFKAENDFELVDSGAEIGAMADVEDYSVNVANTETDTSGRAESIRSASTNSFRVPLSASWGPPWPFDVDLDDTSSEKDIPVPPGLRKAVRKSTSGPSSSGMSSPTEASLGGKIEPWQLQDLLKSLRADKEEEAGGVDTALKRLEGFVDPLKQGEELKNVNDWITTIQKRMETGDYNDDVDSYPGYEEEQIQFDEMEKVSYRQSIMSLDEDRYVGSPTSPVVDPAPGRTAADTPTLPHAPSLATLGSPRVPDAKPVREEHEILNSRSMFPPMTTNFSAPLPRLHQSFIVSYRAEILAQHFAMIDRELFTCLRFEELVSAEWMACQEVNVLDWNQYLRDRARWKTEGRFPEKTSTLAVVRARFNLMTNFVISEVVLAPPSARVLVFKKFLTIAFKSYNMNNFHALAAIVTGLSHELVYKSLGRYWSRITRREHRMFTNFQQFIANVDDFKFMRNAVDSIVQAKPLEDSSHAPSVVSGGTESKHKSEQKPVAPLACIPFIGAYLSQLHRLGRLPDLIDPTAPHLATEIDPNTGTCCLPRYPDVFSALAPLPSFIQLEPLINVHKQRQVAAVIKSLITGQQLARRVHFDIDKKLFHRCLRLRASDISILQRVLDQYPD